MNPRYDEHPFWIVGRGFVVASELKAGDTLELADGTTVKLVKMTVEHFDKLVTVYNFKVADWSTYYIGEDDVLVHNNDFCPVNRVMTDNVKKQLKKNGNGLLKKFERAVDVGFAPRRKNTTGIIKLSSNEIRTNGGFKYNYKLKVTTAGDHLRVYGRVDDAGTLIFDWIPKK